MLLEFTKMQGAGNDYIYINCLEREIKNIKKLAIDLSNRNFGVGGDGIVLICKSQVADAKMRMFNIDGSEGKMCGNAIRCVAKYLYDNMLVRRKTITIETLSGVKTLELNINNGLVKTITVNMGKAELNPKNIPVKTEEDILISKEIEIDNNIVPITCVSMGNPHAVVFCKDPNTVEIEKVGPEFEKNSLFPEGINTEFISVVDKNTLKMRVWERGSGETLACGTGACASVVAAVLNGYCDKNTDVKVILRGGELKIRYTDDAVYMTGPAVKVFEGTYELIEE